MKFKNLLEPRNWLGLLIALIVLSLLVASVIYLSEAEDTFIASWESALKIIGLLSFSLGALSYTVNRKRLDFTVMQSCIKRYNDDFAATILEEQNPEELRKYIDFVNEEMFYIQNDYLPDTVQREWIDGMIDVLPLYDRHSKKLLNKKDCNIKLAEECLYLNYTRVRKACGVDYFKREEIYTEKGEEKNKFRKKLISEIIKNLRNYNRN